METSSEKHRFKGRRKMAAVLAIVLATAIMLGGTYAWMSLDQQGLNTASGEPGAAGGRLHDDYEKFIDDETSQDYKVWAQGVTANKDIYIENYEDPMTGRNIFVRVKLYEFMETGPGTKQGPYLADGVTPNPAYSPTPLIAGTDREDLDTWIPVSSSNGASNRFRSIFTLTRGGGKTFMPTFNMNNQSNETDISGAAIDPQYPLNVSLYPDGAGLHDYWVDTPAKTFTDDERYWDENMGVNGGENTRPSITHEAKPTLNALILTMEQWNSAGQQLGDFWVLDTDGWCYWAHPLAGGEATGLLLDSITLIGEPDDEWFYGIHVRSEMATGNDWSIAFYGADQGEWPTDNAAELLAILTGFRVENFMFTIDTSMTDTLFATADTPDTNPAHFAGTATEFYLPTSGRPLNTHYDWVIDWGDGMVESHAGYSGSYNEGIKHEYAQPGEYQISIRPAGIAMTGWLNAFGFEHPNYSTNDFANDPANRSMLKTINTPFTSHMMTNYSHTFLGCKNAVAIPGDLFSYIDTYGIANLNSLFSGTFMNFAQNSTDATIPPGLFDAIDTSRATVTTGMFNSTFFGFAENSTSGAIPANLFALIDTNNATSMNNMFIYTFRNYAKNSTTDTIPVGLFDSIDTSNATNVQSMFQGTFWQYAMNSTIGDIPAGLFNSIDTGNATNMAALFRYTFMEYAANSDVATIPAGLFDSIDTRSAENLSQMFFATFSSYASNSTGATIPANLFDKIDLENATDISMMFRSTFNGYAPHSTNNTNVNIIWGAANFRGKVTAANAGSADGVFYATFLDMTSLTGSAQTFIDTKLGTNMVPLLRAYTFQNCTNVTDLATIHDNWK